MNRIRLVSLAFLLPGVAAAAYAGVDAQELGMPDVSHLVVERAAMAYRFTQHFAWDLPPSAGEVTFHLPVPTEATKLGFDGEVESQRVADGLDAHWVVDDSAGPELTFSYVLPRDGDILAIPQLPGIESVSVLSTEHLRITGDARSVDQLPPVLLGNEVFAQYKIIGVVDDGSITLEFPSESAPDSEGSLDGRPPIYHSSGHVAGWRRSALSGWDPHFLILVGLLAIGFLVYWAIHQQRESRRSGVRTEGRSGIRRTRVFDALVELENAALRGVIPRKEHARRRKALKNALIRLDYEEERRTGERVDP